MDGEAVIAIIGALFVSPIAIVTMIIYLRRFSNMERMKAIESGADLSQLRIKSGGGRFPTLRFALLLIGVGLGFFLGNILDQLFRMDEVGYFSMLFICGGAGLGLAYIIESKKEKPE